MPEVLDALIGAADRATWKEASTWRNTYPHNYVLSCHLADPTLWAAVHAALASAHAFERFCFGRTFRYVTAGPWRYWVAETCVNRADNSDIERGEAPWQGRKRRS